jgi:drug/metabolite transporter (DMT)-like permease
MVNLLFLGIALQCGGAIIFNVGTLMQKKGADQVPNIHKTSTGKNVRNFLTNKAWMVGYLLIIIGTVANIVALGFGPLSVLQPFLAIGIVVTVVLSRTYLHERVGRNMIGSQVVIIAGVVIMGIASFSGPQPSFPTILSYDIRPGAIAFQVGMVAFAVFCYWYTKATGYRHADIWISLFTGIISVMSYLYTKILMAGILQFGLSLALVSNGLVWIVFGLMITASAASFISRTVAYQHGRAVLINNLYNGLSIALPVPFGVIVLSEWIGVPTPNIALEVIAVAVIIVGIAWMVRIELQMQKVNPNPAPEAEATETQAVEAQ